MKQNDRPLWVCFEGPDGAGKSTLARMFTERLDNAVLLPSPSEGTVGRFARESLGIRRNSLAVEARQLLFLSDVIDTYFRAVVPALMDGKVVVSDRWVMSTLFYHHALLEMEGAEEDGNNSAADMFSLYSILTSGQGPDLTFVVNTPEPVRWSRLSARWETDLNEDSREFQKIVSSLYQDFAPPDVGFYQSGCDLQLTVHGHGNAEREIEQCLRDAARVKTEPMQVYTGLWNRLRGESQ